MMQASKAYALVQGRDFVTPEDIKFVAPYVLQHRLILTAEAEMAGYSRNHLQRVETAVCKPTVGLLLDVSEVLGVPVERLMEIRK